MSSPVTSVLTVGTFDLFHVGHLHLLSACRKLVGEYGTVTVGVNTDRFVDNVIQNDDADLRGMLISTRPTFLAIGSDWKEGDDYFKQTGLSQEWLDAANIYMLYIGRPKEGTSSSKIKTLL